MLYILNEYSKNPICQINLHIGYDPDKFDENGVFLEKGSGLGIDGRVLASEILSLNERDDIDEITFYINTQGGDVQQSIDILTAIAFSKQKTKAIITGLAFSCGGWIPMAANKVEMVHESGSWMGHMPYNPENPEEKSEFMDSIVETISKIISSKSGRNGKPQKTIDEIKSILSKTTYYDAEQMEKEGLVDKVINLAGKTVKFEKQFADNKELLKTFQNKIQTVQNKLLINNNNNKNDSMKRVINRFNVIDKTKTGININLTEDAGEEELVQAIVKVENRLRAVNDDMMDMTTKSANDKLALDAAKKIADDKAKEATEAQNAFNSMKAAHDAMEVENKKMKDEKVAAENLLKAQDLQLRKEKATNLVKQADTEGKIVATASLTKEQVIDFLIEKATNNYDDIAIQLSAALSTFKAAKNKLNNTLVLQGGKKLDESTVNSIIGDMNKVNNSARYFLRDGVKFGFDNKALN